MIRIQDAFRFAKLKIFQHKVRNILSVIAVALGLTIMLVMLLGSTGVLNFGSRMFKDSFTDRFFTREPLYGEDADTVFVQYQEMVKDYRPTEFWMVRKGSDWFSLGGVDSVSHLQVAAYDPLFVNDFLFEGESFEDDGGDVVPVIVSRDWLVQAEVSADWYMMDSKARYEATQRVAEEARGRQVTLFRQSSASGGGIFGAMQDASAMGDQQGEDTGVTVEIVGLSSSGFGDSFGVGYSDVVMPLWALEEESVAKLFEVAGEQDPNFFGTENSVITEFANKDDRDAFVQAGINQLRSVDPSSADDTTFRSMPQPVIGRFEMFQEIVSIVRRVVFGIGGFLLFIAMCFILVNISKAVADSRKEIGVFRAVGARALDIQRIFYSFAFLVVNAGFLAAFVIASSANMVASMKWGDNMFYEMASMGTSPVLDIPKFLFIGFDIPALVMLYLIVLVSTMLAAAIPAFRASRIDPVVALKD